MLTLSPEAAEQIATACRGAPGCETGGLLIGTADESGTHVWVATGPGRRAVAERKTLQIDVSFMLGVMAGIDVAGIVRVLGRWHKHVAPDLRPSEDDTRGAEAFRQLCEFASGHTCTVELIVGTDGDAPIGYGAYRCSSDGLQRIECISSPRPAGANASAADFPSRPAATPSRSR